MARFQVSDYDRKKYDLPEHVPFDAQVFTNKEADALEQQAGVSPLDWLEMLGGEIVETREGVPVLDDGTGEPAKALTFRTRSLLYWLAVRRHGLDVAWADFEFSLVGWALLPDPEDVEEMGKEPPVPEDEPSPS